MSREEKQKYTSSIIHKYGDTDKVSRDSAVVFEILERQGNDFLLDLVAEYVGRTANNFKLDSIEIERIKDSLVEHLTNAIEERT